MDRFWDLVRDIVLFVLGIVLVLSVSQVAVRMAGLKLIIPFVGPLINRGLVWIGW